MRLAPRCAGRPAPTPVLGPCDRCRYTEIPPAPVPFRCRRRNARRGSRLGTRRCDGGSNTRGNRDQARGDLNPPRPASEPTPHPNLQHNEPPYHATTRQRIPERDNYTRQRSGSPRDPRPHVDRIAPSSARTWELVAAWKIGAAARTEQSGLLLSSAEAERPLSKLAGRRAAPINSPEAERPPSQL